MGDLREEQLITTYGPGSIIDLLDYPVLIQSASYWLKEEVGNNYDPVNSESLKIQDLAIHELVEKKLIELTESSSFKIKKIKGLMKPPPEANEFNQYLGTIASKVITAQRFPRYHKCLKCNTLSKLDKEDQDNLMTPQPSSRTTGAMQATGVLGLSQSPQVTPSLYTI